MTDIDKCSNDECNLKENCYRFTLKVDGYYWSTRYKPNKNNTCDYFLDNNK